MSSTARERLAALLAENVTPSGFSASRMAPAESLHLEVKGVGAIKLPVPQVQAKQLCVLSRPARYGRGEQTLLDRSVRDTWEVPKSRIKIDKRRWDQTLVPVVDQLRGDLGLPAGCQLRAELHSMLIYAPGQFFLPHQDSEKDDAMVGSLVVGLPSAFSGGALEVHRRGETATYRGSKKSLSFAAFYSDCRHEIKPVTSGYRVVLTYDLLARRDTRSSLTEADFPLVSKLADALGEHFEETGAPGRLVFLLDHEYTKRGLGWSRLKGDDARAAALLEAAGGRAECDVALALADVHETWSAYEEERSSRWHRYHDWDDDDEDDDDDDEDDDSSSGGDSEEYDLQELIESEITLDSFIDAAGARLSTLGLEVHSDEVCASTPSEDLEPYSSEYEGYMGNWGNTLDRWYHRGAIVLWPRRLAFALRAEASPAWALDTLIAQLRKGDVAGAREAAATLEPFWAKVAGRMAGKSFFTKALRTASLLDDPALAAMVLRPFRLEMLGRTHAKAICALVAGYGEPWAAELVARWSIARRYDHATGPSPAAWIASLPQLCDALAKTETAGVAAARLLLEDAWMWARKALETGLEQPSPSRREQALSALGGPLAGVLEGATLIRAPSIGDDAIGCLRANGDELVGCAVAVLRATPPSKWSATGLQAVADHVRGVLALHLARPRRGKGDWSIEAPPGCACALCAELGVFLADATRARFEWPLRQDSRAHVHRRIDIAELAVTHQTRRTGRPYTLVLTKTDALFEREDQARRRAEADLAWLGRGIEANSTG